MFKKLEANGEVMEILEGGELFDRIIDCGRFSERDPRTIFSESSDSCLGVKQSPVGRGWQKQRC